MTVKLYVRTAALHMVTVAADKPQHLLLGFEAAQGLMDENKHCMHPRMKQGMP